MHKTLASKLIQDKKDLNSLNLSQLTELNKFYTKQSENLAINESSSKMDSKFMLKVYEFSNLTARKIAEKL